MSTTLMIRRTVPAVLITGLLALATACGNQTATGEDQLPAAPVKDRSSVVRQGSPDSIERRLAAAQTVPQGSPDSIERRLAGLELAVPQGSPDTLERRLANAQADTACHVSADAAERRGAEACPR